MGTIIEKIHFLGAEAIVHGLPFTVSTLERYYYIIIKTGKNFEGVDIFNLWIILSRQVLVIGFASEKNLNS